MQESGLISLRSSMATTGVLLMFLTLKCSGRYSVAVLRHDDRRDTVYRKRRSLHHRLLPQLIPAPYTLQYPLLYLPTQPL